MQKSSYSYNNKCCQICEKKFSLYKIILLYYRLLRSHTCKRCKRLICPDCGKNKAFVI